MAIMYSRHVRRSPATVYSFRLCIDGSGLGLLPNADLQISSSDLLYTGALPYQLTARQQP